MQIKILMKPSLKIKFTPKEEGLLWTEMLEYLYLLNKKNHNSYIPYKNLFECICRKFSIKKAKAWNCIFFLREFGFIEIVRFKGIKLTYEIN
jgi:hypothetical protein